MSFEICCANKYRFTSPLKGGTMTPEDLFDLSLHGLNAVAKRLNKQIKATDEESFIGEKSSVDKELEIKFAVVKRVIEIKLAARDAIADAKEKKDFNEGLMSLIKKKENEERENLSIDELKALMK